MLPWAYFLFSIGASYLCFERELLSRSETRVCFGGWEFGSAAAQGGLAVDFVGACVCVCGGGDCDVGEMLLVVGGYRIVK